MTAATVLTDREAQAVEFITAHADDHGYPPTVREVGAALGISSPATVAALIGRLVRKGVLRRTPGVPRSLVVIGVAQ